MQFNAQWAKCTLASAYRLWQLGVNRSPPPPANTVNPFGMQLSSRDAVVAEREFPGWLTEFHSMDFQFSVLREKYEIQQARESTEQWKRDAVAHLASFSADTRHSMDQYMPLLRQWEVGVQNGRFSVCPDVTVDDIRVSLMEYREQAGNFQSKAFNGLWN